MEMLLRIHNSISPLHAEFYPVTGVVEGIVCIEAVSRPRSTQYLNVENRFKDPGSGIFPTPDAVFLLPITR